MAILQKSLIAANAIEDFIGGNNSSNSLKYKNNRPRRQQTVFDQPVKNIIRKYEHVQKIATAQGDDYTTGCLLGYNYFRIYYKIIATDLIKQQSLDADLKATKPVSFVESLENNLSIFFIIEEAKETVLDFHKEL